MRDLLLRSYLAVNLALRGERGQSVTEYTMAAGLIALGCVAGETAIASSVNHTFVAIATTITTGIAR